MGTLVFVCPTSCRETFTGLESDQASFEGLPKVLAEIKLHQLLPSAPPGPAMVRLP
jgi:hypothetical protein